MERRLTVIFAAVVGYSQLMGLDEAGTLAALKAHRREMADGRIAEHQGRIVKLTGDGMLVEFPSAAEIQRKMRERNTGVPEDRRIEFRIGIHLGEFERALDLLERLLPHANRDTKSWARADADFIPLHGHPRWQKGLELTT